MLWFKLGFTATLTIVFAKTFCCGVRNLGFTATYLIQMDQNDQRRELHEQTRAREQEIREQEIQISAKEEEIYALKRDSRGLKEDMIAVEERIPFISFTEDRKRLDEKLQFLRQELISIWSSTDHLQQQIVGLSNRYTSRNR